MCRISGEVCHTSALLLPPTPKGLREPTHHLFIQQTLTEHFCVLGPTLGGGELELNRAEGAAALLGFAMCGKHRHETYQPSDHHVTEGTGAEKKGTYRRRQRCSIPNGRWEGLSEKGTFRLKTKRWRPRVETQE